MVFKLSGHCFLVLVRFGVVCNVKNFVCLFVVLMLCVKFVCLLC